MTYNIALFKEACPITEADYEKVAYSTDSSCIQGSPLAVAIPQNAEQLQKLVRIAARERIPLTVRGGGTSLVGGAVPIDSIVIDLSKFNKIKRFDQNEKKVVVEAGVILDSLNTALSKYNLEFPVKPGSHAACTIGGMIATNAGGMLSPAFGKTENWVEVITMMDGSGKVFDFSGDDISKFSGTEGCCGIILEARLKLNETAAHYSTAFYEFDDIHKLMNKVNELKADPDVVAVEYINSIAAKMAGMREKDHLIVKFTGSKGHLDTTAAEKIWKLRENIYSILFEQGYTQIEDPMIENGMDKFLDWIKKQEIPCYGHIAYGVIHPHFTSQEQTEKMNAIIKELNGKFVGEHGVGILKRKVAPFTTVQKIKELKVQYDPYSILNKGKVI